MRGRLVRNANDHLLYIIREDGTSFLAEILQDNILKIRENITQLISETEYDPVYFRTNDNTLTFRLISDEKKRSSNPYQAGGGGGTRGIFVQEEGTQVNGLFKTINFIGGTVTVTDAGAGVANVSITAAIAGSGTLNFIPKWTPDGNSLGNSIAFDDGTNIGISTTSPASKFHVNGAIRTGLASTTNGSLIFNNSTNANTLTINSGVTSASHSWTLPLAQGAANSFLMNDGAGTLSWNTGTGIFFAQGGNSFGVAGRLGTNDAFALEFETNNTLAGTISSAQLWSIGSVAPVAGVRLYVGGTGTTSATFALRVQNSTPITLLDVRNDGYISAGIANGSMTIGLNAGWDETLIGNTSLGVASGGGSRNTFVGNNSGNSVTSITGGSRNVAVGQNAGGGFTSDFGHVSIGWSALGTQAGNSSTTEGEMNVSVGYNNLVANTTGLSLVSIGAQALVSNTTGIQNTAVGAVAGFTAITASGNVFLGYAAGHFETGGNKLFIDNAKRANEADGRIKALVYGVFAATTAAQSFTHNSNVGIGTSTIPATSDFVLVFKTGAAPTADVADQFSMYSADQAAGNAAPHFRTENGSIIKLYLQTLTNSTGGAASTDLEDVTTLGLADPAKINNNFTEIFTILDNLGLV